MSFDEVVNKAKKPRPEPNMGGVFECQHCFTPNTGAHYDPDKKLLRWWCDNCDKVSKIEEFSI